MSFKNIISATLLLLMGSVVYAQEQDTTKTKQLQEVTVFGRSEVYKKDTLQSINRLNIRQLDLPQSVQSVPAKILRDQQVISVVEAGKNINGINFPTQITGEFSLRGFGVDYQNSLLINGMRAATGNGYTTLPLYNIASLEAIKGPASALFSIAQPGGVLNLETFKPQSEKGYNIELNYGSWNLLRFRADATGPLTKDKKLLYRFIAGGSTSESFRDFQKTTDLFLAPSLTYLFSDKTKLTFEYNYIREGYTYPFDYGTYVGVNGDGTPNFDESTLGFSGSNPNDKGKATSNMVYLNFEHRFSKLVKLNVLANYNNRNTDAAQHLTGFGFFNATNDTIFGRAYIDFVTKSYNYNVNTFATFDYTTGSKIKHTLVTGFDFGKYGISDNTFSFNYGNVLPLPINNPNYALDNPSSYVFDDPTFGIKETDTEDKRVVGGYIQNFTDFGKVKVLLGLRYDNFKALNTFFPNYQTEATRDTSEANALLPRVGLVYQPLNNLSFYASYSTSFRPQTSNNSLSGGPFDPEKGVQYEVGVKSELLKDKVFATIALYSIDKNNLLIRDVTDPLGQRRIAVDAVNSQGVEFTLQGNIAKSLNLILNYAYNDARFTSDAENNKKGDRLINAPTHIFSSWATYGIQLNDNSRIKVGAGLRYNSNAVTAFSANPQTFLVPAYTVADASIGYNYKKFIVQFNLNNIANTRYFTGAYGFVSVFEGAPRNFRLALTYQW